MAKSEDYLHSIKSRMAWQVGLQTATLFAIGDLNSSIKQQCGLIANEIITLNKSTSEGLLKVENAIESLEASLIYGIDELKWILGSIDDKLKVIIGLIQFPKTTESSEKYLIGCELYKTEYYKEAIDLFQSAIKSSPLNLNARVGLFLSLSKLNDQKDIHSLIEIAKLTQANFYVHQDVTEDIKHSSVLFFTNFVGSQLCFLNEHKAWIDLFENTIPNFAQKDLTNKIRYIESLIITDNDYSKIVSEVFEEGKLGLLLFGLNYKETDSFSKFIEFCFRLCQNKLQIQNKDNLTSKYDFPILKAMHNLIDYVSSKEGLFILGKLDASLAEKNNLLQSLYALYARIPKYYQTEQENKKSLENDLIAIKAIELETKSEEQNEFLKDTFKLISQSYKAIIDDYKIKETTNRSSNIFECDIQLAKYQTSVPILEDSEMVLCTLILKYFSEPTQKEVETNSCEIGIKELLLLFVPAKDKEEDDDDDDGEEDDDDDDGEEDE